MPLRWRADRIPAASLLASFLLSRSVEEGLEYRQVLGIDTGSETLQSPDAGAVNVVAAFGSVALTGYAASYEGNELRGTGAPSLGRSPPHGSAGVDAAVAAAATMASSVGSSAQPASGRHHSSATM